VVNLVSLLAAPVIVKYSTTEGGVSAGAFIVAVILLIGVGWAIRRSKAPVKPLDVVLKEVP